MTDLLVEADTEENFQYWLEQPFITPELKQELSVAQVLIVPTVGFRNDEHITFPVETESFLDYMRKNMPLYAPVDICISGEDFEELALNSNYRRIGVILVKELALPIFITVFSSYVYDNYVKPKEASQPTITVSPIVNVKVDNIINSNDGTNKEGSTKHDHTSNEHNITSGKKHSDKHATHNISKAVEKEYMMPPKVKFTLIIERDSTHETKKFSYDGPAEKVGTVLKALSDSTTIFNDNKRPK